MSTSVLFLKPEIGIIQELVIQRATTQWRSIGTELLTKKNDTAQLGIIQAANPTSHKHCCYDMLDYWLLNYPNATWEDLLKALRSPAVGHNALAAEVEKEIKLRHSRGTLSRDQITLPESQTKQPTVLDEVKMGKQPTQDPDNKANREDEPDAGNEGNGEEEESCTTEAKIKKKKSKYPVIQKDTPMFGIVINNHKFDDPDQLPERKGSTEDVKRIKLLAEYGLEFCLTLENCKAKEMKAIFEVVSFSARIKDILGSASATEGCSMKEALEKFSADDTVKMTIEGMIGKECKIALETVTENKGRLEAVANMLEKPLSKSSYHGVMVFIMTHGGEGGILYGTDGEFVAARDIAALFNASKCKQLIDRPKIFVIQACRGDEDEHGAKREGKGASNTNNKNRKASFGIVSDEADFLFAYSTPDHYVTYRYEDGTPFIKSFVGVLNERLNNEHLEDTLLVVKEKVADEVMRKDGKLYKQMPSVVSQMTDKVWFHK